MELFAEGVRDLLAPISVFDDVICNRSAILASNLRETDVSDTSTKMYSDGTPILDTFEAVL